MNRTFSGKRPFNGYQLCSYSQKLLFSVFRVNANSYISSHRISRQHWRRIIPLPNESFFLRFLRRHVWRLTPCIEKPCPCSPGRIYAPIHTSGGVSSSFVSPPSPFFRLRPVRTFCFREMLLRIPRKTHPKMKKALSPCPAHSSSREFANRIQGEPRHAQRTSRAIHWLAPIPERAINRVSLMSRERSA